MLLIGLKNETTSTGHTEDNWGSVNHQRMDIILGSPKENWSAEELTKAYHEMVKKGEKSWEKLAKLSEELEFSNMSEEEYERLHLEYSKDTKILKYDKILIIDGVVLK